MTRVILLAMVLAFISPANAAASECRFKFCQNRTVESPKVYLITNNHRQILGDLYDPGTGGRVQIRNNHRHIIGYIERDGTVTNTHRQKVGTLDW